LAHRLSRRMVGGHLKDGSMERRYLQIAVALAGLVPVLAGALGALRPELLDLIGPPHALTHAAYLSGLLLGLGLSFWSLIPTIERQTQAVTLLTGLVVVGGLARALTAARLGTWGLSVVLPLVMELGVTPALWAWQRRVARSSISRPE
jgi:hypothetical protein